MLPGKDGFTVMSEVRQAGQFIPTLMLTARGHPDDVLRGFAAGADDYLAKPFDLAILIARILLWGLHDSKSSLEELRHHLPELPEGDFWISNDAQERLGLIAFGDELPDLGEIPRLVGKDPDVAEEFDVE